jgi:autotransporter-associated beta strand protein
MSLKSSISGQCCRAVSLRLFALLGALVTVGSGELVEAQTTYYWNGANISASPAAGGTGTWSTTNAWRTVTDTGAQGTWTAASGGTNAAILAGTAGTITLGTSGSTNFTGSTMTVNTSGYTITTSSASRNVAFTGNLTLADSVALILTNSGTGGNLNSFGGIVFGTGSSLSIQGGATANNANRVNLTAAGTISGGSITLDGTGAGVTGLVSTATIVSGGAILNTNILNNSATSATMLGATNGNLLTYGGILSGSANLQISAGQSGGAGIVTMSNNSDYTGGTYLNGATNGVFRMGVDNALPTGTTVFMGASAGGGTADDGGSIDLNGLNLAIGGLEAGSSARGIGNNTATLSTLTIGKATGTNTFGGVIGTVSNNNLTTQTNNIAVVKNGGSKQIFSGANTYTGTTTINGGTLSVTGDAQLGTAPVSAADNITINGGRLEITGTTQTLNANRNILLGDTANTSISTPGGSNVITYDGVFKDLTGNNGILVKQGGGTLQLGGVSTYTGNTSINNGTVRLTTGDNRLPTGTVVSLGQAASDNLGTLDLNGQNQTIAGLQSTAGTNASVNTNVVTSVAAATLTIDNSSDFTYSAGTAENSGIISGAISLVKEGSGTQTLTGANTYAGTTSVNEGILIINGNQSAATGNVTVAAPATLGGTGTIGGDTTISGTLNAGTAGTPGTLAFASGRDLSFASGSTWLIDIVDNAHDSLTGIDVLNITDANLSFAFSGTQTAASYTIATYGSRNSAFFNTFANGAHVGGSGAGYIISYGPESGGAITLTAVPEPGTLTLLGLGLGGLIARRIRRKRKAAQAA